MGILYREKTTNINLLTQELIDLLKEKDLKIATAESCTGGLISNFITDIPGASEVFACGICAYSNEIKEKVLNVSKRTIERYTAVSRETAMEMAANVRRIAYADIGLSVTGYAGPAGYGKKEIVGLVYFGLSMFNATKCFKDMFKEGHGNGRINIKKAAATKGICLALDFIKTGQ